MIKKLVVPVAISLALISSVKAEEYINPGLSSPVAMQKMIVQTNTLNDFGAQTHPLSAGIIVKYKNSNKSLSVKDAQTKTIQLGKDLGVSLKFKRMMSGNAEVISLNSMNKSYSAKDIQALAESINDRDDVEYAEVDAWMVISRTPNDPRYSDQWHYANSAGGMNLPGAWDTTIGSSAVTVAVLDTGYRPHADLTGNIVGQYDMISSSSVGNDGNGRDSNAQDPGDWIAENQCGDNDAEDSSWHGTHVAGTVAAVSDNGAGVAGVAWNINLVPVRVLGTCGGSLSDIADGIRWAAGLSVSGVPSNSNPADIINMSLGSVVPAACSSTYQNAINAAVNAGATVVVAVGNENSSLGYPPANCSNVISVAAGGQDGSRAYFSNYGSSVDITAPGGDGCNPTTNSEPTSLSDCEGNVWDETRMILSTHNGGTQGPGSDTYGWLQGTSMAAPHVAGLAALIKSVDSSLTPAEVEQVIKDTADSFANVPDHQCTTSICGVGYANATAAIDSLTTAPPGASVLTNGVAKTGLSAAITVETQYTLEVPAGATNLSFVMNGGSGDADLYVRFGAEPTTGTYDCRPYRDGNNETCNISSAQTGTYYVMVRAFSAYSGVSLLGSYTAGGAQQSFFQNTNNVNIPDNNASGGTSTINVNRTGNTGSIVVAFEVVHTWRGDLSVKLVAPNGGEVVLHERTNTSDSTDNLSKTVNVNAGTTPANGNWRLVVTDGAGQDTGYIDSWSIQF